MCCFAGSTAVHVADTSIFARFVAPGVQALVYSLELSTASEVAMILPLPVAPGAGDDAAVFTSLERHAGFFADLRALFTPPPSRSGERMQSLGFGPRQTLKVHAVGAFEASFVPTRADFSRLDPRFRLPDAVWQGLGGYASWGFAVFRLQPGTRAHIHPMALTFPSSDPRLFFPTVHVHDGKVHARATFDHALYYQGVTEYAGERAWIAPAKPYEGLVAAGEPMFRTELRGKLPNRDTWIV